MESAAEIIYEGIKTKIEEFIRDMKFDAETDLNLGWSFDQMIAELDEVSGELEDEIEKAEYWLDYDEELVESLKSLLDDAYNEVEDYIIEIAGQVA